MRFFLAACLFYAVSSTLNPKLFTKLFHPDRIIFSSDFNITSVLVPADSINLMENPSTIPTVFFTVTDPSAEGGSCIYVLQGLTVYEILEGGRDTTSDYSTDNSVFFGAWNGIYKYNPETLSGNKFGPFQDDIKQIQKANGTDLIYILTVHNELYKIGKNGTTRERVTSVKCATQFVLDTSNRIYYVACDVNIPYIVRDDGSVFQATDFAEDCKEIKLLRPAFLMEKSIPFIADGGLYVLDANGLVEKKEFSLDRKPSAYSVDASIYIIAALDGKIYEFDMMDVMLKSMFGPDGIEDLTRIAVQIMDRPKHSELSFRNVLM